MACPRRNFHKYGCFEPYLLENVFHASFPLKTIFKNTDIKVVFTDDCIIHNTDIETAQLGPLTFHCFFLLFIYQYSY